MARSWGAGRRRRGPSLRSLRACNRAFVAGERLEFKENGRWRPGTYLNAYSTWHIVEDRSGNRIAVRDRDVRRRARKTTT